MGTVGMDILQTNSFARKTKKLHRNQKIELDNAIKAIIANPSIGTEKTGDLKGIYVHKFKMVKQQVLIAYQYNEKELILLALGDHENFYRDLKQLTFSPKTGPK